MTTIPERKEGQTWVNYFIERLEERGADIFVCERDFWGNGDSLDCVSKGIRQDDIIDLEVTYQLLTVNTQHQSQVLFRIVSFYELDASAKRFLSRQSMHGALPQNLNYKCTGTEIYWGRYSDDNRHIYCLEKKDTVETSLKSIVTENLPRNKTLSTAKALCELADLVLKEDRDWRNQNEKNQ